jgi:ribose transport system permease protein/putative xylitol transport system permease protein
MIITLVFFVFLIGFFTLMNPNFFTFYNFQNLIRQSAILLIASIGATFIIITGSIDLSGPGIVGVSGIITALYVPMLGKLAIMVGPVFGLTAGFLNGFIFTMTKIPSFLVTLGMFFVLEGLGLYISGGRPIIFRSITFQELGAGSLFGIPILGFWALGIFLLTIFIAKRTYLGRYLYFIGAEESVANLCGIPIVFCKMFNFALAGVLYGFAGSLLTARMGSAWPGMGGTDLLLNMFAAVVMGGTALSGGVGGPEKTIIGVGVIAVLSNGMNIMGVDPYLQIIIKGIVVIAAVAITIDRSKIKLVK